MRNSIAFCVQERSVSYRRQKGSSVVKIYRDPRPSGEYYRVVFHLGEKRQRLIFRDNKAKNEAAAHSWRAAVQLTGKDRLTYGRAAEAVRSFDVSLDAAAIEYAEAHKVLKGHPLVEAKKGHPAGLFRVGLGQTRDGSRAMLPAAYMKSMGGNCFAIYLKNQVHVRISELNVVLCSPLSLWPSLVFATFGKEVFCFLIEPFHRFG